MFCSTSQFAQPSADFVMAGLGVTKSSVLKKLGCITCLSARVIFAH